MSDTQELRRIIARLRERNEQLEAQLNQVRADRDAADFRVRHELEPRISSENRNYDHWVTSPDRGTP